MKIVLTAIVSLLIFSSGCAQQNTAKFAVTKTDAEWKKQLTPEQFEVSRKKGTERPFTGKIGIIMRKEFTSVLIAGKEVFSADTKFESGTGWPSFWQPFKKQNVAETVDNAYGMQRTEVHCSKCGGHLGHIFNDGPAPTGLRYCINSASLTFTKK